MDSNRKQFVCTNIHIIILHVTVCFQADVINVVMVDLDKFQIILTFLLTQLMYQLFSKWGSQLHIVALLINLPLCSCNSTAIHVAILLPLYTQQMLDKYSIRVNLQRSQEKSFFQVNKNLTYFQKQVKELLMTHSFRCYKSRKHNPPGSQCLSVSPKIMLLTPHLSKLAIQFLKENCGASLFNYNGLSSVVSLIQNTWNHFVEQVIL